MNMLNGIIIAGVGLLVAVLGFTKILPHMGWTGVWLVLLGGLFFGLSFVPRPEALESEPMSFPISLTSMFYAPTEVFRNLRRHPRFIGVILVMALISGAYTFAFFNRVGLERIANHTIDKVIESGWVQADKIPEFKAETLEATVNNFARTGQAINSFTGLIFLVAFLALIFWLIALAFGAQMNYWQGLAATAYALFPVTVLQKGFSFLILFLKDPIDIHPILGQTSLVQDSLNFLVAPADSAVLYVLLSSFGLLSIYSLWLIATGLKNAGERVSSTAAWFSSIFVWVIGLTFGVIMALLFGNFMS